MRDLSVTIFEFSQGDTEAVELALKQGHLGDPKGTPDDVIEQWRLNKKIPLDYKKWIESKTKPEDVIETGLKRWLRTWPEIVSFLHVVAACYLLPCLIETRRSDAWHRQDRGCGQRADKEGEPHHRCAAAHCTSSKETWREAQPRSKEDYTGREGVGVTKRCASHTPFAGGESS